MREKCCFLKKFTPLTKILHCCRQWQTSPLSGQRLVCYQTWFEDNQGRDNLLSGPLWNRHFKCRYISVCPSFYCWVFLTTELHLFINHCETTFPLVVNHEEYEINLDILDYFPHFIDCSKIITNTNRVSATECLVWNEVARWLMDKVFTRFLRPLNAMVLEMVTRMMMMMDYFR